MKHRRLISICLFTAMLPAIAVQARPEFWGPDDRWEHHGHHGHHGYDRGGPVIINQRPVVIYDRPEPRARYQIMPPGYKTVIAAGATYFVLNELWYRMHGGMYEQVAAPTSTPQGSNVTIINNGTTTTTIANTGSMMNVVDINGNRYYTQEGRYYRRTPDGQYYEVAVPNGLY